MQPDETRPSNSFEAMIVDSSSQMPTIGQASQTVAVMDAAAVGEQQHAASAPDASDLETNSGNFLRGGESQPQHAPVAAGSEELRAENDEEALNYLFRRTTLGQPSNPETLRTSLRERKAADANSDDEDDEHNDFNQDDEDAETIFHDEDDADEDGMLTDFEPDLDEEDDLASNPEISDEVAGAGNVQGSSGLFVEDPDFEDEIVSQTARYQAGVKTYDIFGRHQWDNVPLIEDGWTTMMRHTIHRNFSADIDLFNSVLSPLRTIEFQEFQDFEVVTEDILMFD